MDKPENTPQDEIADLLDLIEWCRGRLSPVYQPYVDRMLKERKRADAE